MSLGSGNGSEPVSAASTEPAGRVEPAGPAERAAEVERTLGTLRRIATELLLDAPRAPRSLRVQAGDARVELEWPEVAAPAPAPTAAVETTVTTVAAVAAAASAEPVGPQLVAGTVGVFYRAPQPGAGPFVAEGDEVVPGQQVAIIEAMKMMIPVESDRAGRIVAALVQDGQPVEYGQPLFALEPAG
jgi:acetyl-CoA carboxylase biotin carboxyl carrier protein